VKNPQDGADGVVIVRYRGKIARFKGGTIERKEGWIMHIFIESGTLKTRWWQRKPVEVQYYMRGGGGGASGVRSGEDGELKAGEFTLTEDELHVRVGKGGSGGIHGVNGGASWFGGVNGGGGVGGSVQ